MRHARAINSIPALPPPTVIPAKAGIHCPPTHTPGLPGFWIPAGAGMTVSVDGNDGRGGPVSRALGMAAGFSLSPTLSRWERAFRWPTRTPSAAGEVGAALFQEGAVALLIVLRVELG